MPYGSFGFGPIVPGRDVGCHRVTQSGDPSPCGIQSPRDWRDPACTEKHRPGGPSMSEARGALPHPRTLSRYHTRLSERDTTHHGSTGFPPGTAGEPSRYAGEEQGERDSECVKPTSDPSGTSRIEEMNDATLGGKPSFERGRPSNESKGKPKIEEEMNIGMSE